ncbi:tRNA ligase [Hesseltinella vesiculosa]|uniref:tRNA ligase n=1 Tax=Hesseltinella vesiculosa TaxID=101127 RepID=A0A1X2GTY2_9FUNG|nr:tRNA ligase [Hesseltinella vesiculosa]
MARGLFTTKVNDRYMVKVRGYDKFFGIGETHNTQWPALKKTKGPFEVSAKENGCIIFIAATSSSEWIATSKHMVPIPKDDPQSHGGVGYRWVLQHLAQAGRSPDELAQWLFVHRVTLVAELCDDDFEEHVVPYTQRERGLYLHGINYNTTTLRTLPMTQVHAIANHFGFHQVPTKLFDTIDDIKTLATHIEQDQTAVLTWLDTDSERECEGVVIRCLRYSPDNTEENFFFKVKNDKYLMYREYREVTRMLLTFDADGTVGMVDKLPSKNLTKCRFEKTLYYAQWLKLRILDHPEWFKDFRHNKGIVAVRQHFEQDWADGNVTINAQGNLDVPLRRDTTRRT